MDRKEDDSTLSRRPTKKRELVVKILLLNDEWMQVNIGRQLLGSDLYNMAASRFKLHEKDCFGLLVDSPNPRANQWVDMDTRVLDQPFAKKAPATTKNEIKMSFCVRYFGGQVTMFREFTTQKLFFYQAKRDIYSGIIQCPKDTTVQLCALALQVMEGDHLSDSATRNVLDNGQLLPDSTIVDFGHSLEACAKEINCEYKKLAGTSQPSAVLSYMTIVQQQPTYGVHYYEVKDNGDRPYLLGVGPRGIAQYDVTDTHTPRKSWEWLSLTNVWWKKNKFFLELDENSSGNKLVNQSYVWKTASPTQSDLILKMVHFQHTNSLRCEKLTETRRRRDYLANASLSIESKGNTGTALKTPHKSLGDGDDISVSSFNTPAVVPAAQEVSLPRTAASFTRLLSEAQTGSQSTASPIPIRTFSSNAEDFREDSGRSATSDNSRDTLEKLERRRDQILAELTRKRRLVAQYEKEEAEFAATPTSSPGKKGSEQKAVKVDEMQDEVQVVDGTSQLPEQDAIPVVNHDHEENSLVKDLSEAITTNGEILDPVTVNDPVTANDIADVDSLAKISTSITQIDPVRQQSNNSLTSLNAVVAATDDIGASQPINYKKPTESKPLDTSQIISEHIPSVYGEETVHTSGRTLELEIQGETETDSIDSIRRSTPDWAMSTSFTQSNVDDASLPTNSSVLESVVVNVSNNITDIDAPTSPPKTPPPTTQESKSSPHRSSMKKKLLTALEDPKSRQVARRVSFKDIDVVTAPPDVSQSKIADEIVAMRPKNTSSDSKPEERPVSMKLSRDRKSVV